MPSAGIFVMWYQLRCEMLWDSWWLHWKWSEGRTVLAGCHLLENQILMVCTWVGTSLVVMYMLSSFLTMSSADQWVTLEWTSLNMLTLPRIHNVCRNDQNDSWTPKLVQIMSLMKCTHQQGVHCMCCTFTCTCLNWLIVLRSPVTQWSEDTCNLPLIALAGWIVVYIHWSNWEVEDL